MDLELLIHGVPDGQDYYGIKEGQTNMGLSYDNSIESVKFVVETKKQGNTAYTYYSYLKYKGMIGSGGRPGSYFGLTLRIDKYYQDALHIYSLLDILFKRYIIGTLLAPSGDGYKYIVSNFATKSAEIDKAQQALIQLIQTTCVNAKFLDIDASFIRPITNAPAGNINDVTDSAILASIKKYSKVVLSPDYESNIEKEYKKKLQEAEGKGGNIVAQKDKTIAEKDGVINSLNTTISTQQNRIAVLEQEVKRKETEIQQQKQKGDLAQVVAKLKEPITALADYFRVKDSQNHQPTPKYGYKNFRLGMVNTIISSVIVILLAFHIILSPKGNSTDGSKKEYTELKKQYDELSRNYDKLLSDYNSLLNNSDQKAEEEKKVAEAKKKAEEEKKAAEAKKKAEEERKAAEAKKKAEEEKKAAEAKKKAEEEKKAAEAKKKAEEEKKAAGAVTSSVTISIFPNVTAVEIGKEYTLSISDYDGKGQWTFDGFEPQKGTKMDKTIVVKAKISTTGGVATATYTPENGIAKTTTFKYKGQ